MEKKKLSKKCSKAKSGVFKHSFCPTNNVKPKYVGETKQKLQIFMSEKLKPENVCNFSFYHWSLLVANEKPVDN